MDGSIDGLGDGSIEGLLEEVTVDGDDDESMLGSKDG